MSTFILVLLGLAVFHFIYEGVLAPSWRMLLRNRLFKLRDGLRSLKIGGLSGADEQAFWYVHDGVNHMLTRLPSLTLIGLWEAVRAYQGNEVLREKIEERRALLERCENRKIVELFEEAQEGVKEAIIANMGGWLIYLVPAFVLWAALNFLTRLASSILLAPESETDRWFSGKSSPLSEKYA